MKIAKIAAAFCLTVASTLTVATVSAQSFTDAELEEILASETMTVEEIAALELRARGKNYRMTQSDYDIMRNAEENYENFLKVCEATVEQLPLKVNWSDSSPENESVENYRVAKDDARAVTAEHAKTLSRMASQAQAKHWSSWGVIRPLLFRIALINARHALLEAGISQASTSSQNVKVALKTPDDARPFVFARGPARMKKSYEKVFDNYFNDEVDFFFESWNCDLRIIVAINPATRKWIVWSEYVNLNLIDDAEINFYHLTEGPVFEGNFDDEDKLQHVRVMKGKIARLEERERKAARDAERGARASARNAGRIAKQNALIRGSLEFHSRVGH